MEMNAGMLILRLVVGLTMAAHGAQGLFGWFGGPGLAGTASFLEQMGFRPGELHAALVGGSELAGGLLLALGLLTPLGTAAVTGSMVAAIATVHWEHGFFLANMGFEYNLVLIASALAIAFVGPGRFSVDRVFGWTLSGVRWGIAAAAVGVVTAAGVVAVRQQPAPGNPSSQSWRATPSPETPALIAGAGTWSAVAGSWSVAWAQGSSGGCRPTLCSALTE